MIPGTDAPAQFDMLRIRFRMSTGSNPMFRRIAMEKIGLFDVSFIRHQDTEYMIRILRHYKVGIIPEYLVTKYVFGYPNRPNVHKYMEVQEYFFNVFTEDIKQYSEDEQAEIYRNNWHQMCVVAIEAGDYKVAMDCYNKANSYKQVPLRTKLGLLKRIIFK